MDMSHDLTLSRWATDSNDRQFLPSLPGCAAIHSQTNLALVRSEIRQRAA